MNVHANLIIILTFQKIIMKTNRHRKTSINFCFTENKLGSDIKKTFETCYHRFQINPSSGVTNLEPFDENESLLKMI